MILYFSYPLQDSLEFSLHPPNLLRLSLPIPLMQSTPSHNLLSNASLKSRLLWVQSMSLNEKRFIDSADLISSPSDFQVSMSSTA